MLALPCMVEKRKEEKEVKAHKVLHIQASFSSSMYLQIKVMFIS